MSDEEYVEVELGDETYVLVPEGGFAGDESRKDIRVLDADEDVSNFKSGVEHAGTRVGVDPSQYDSQSEMYRDAVERALDQNAGSILDEFLSGDPLEEDDTPEEENDKSGEDSLEALDMYGGN